MINFFFSLSLSSVFIFHLFSFHFITSKLSVPLFGHCFSFLPVHIFFSFLLTLFCLSYPVSLLLSYPSLPFILFPFLSFLSLLFNSLLFFLNCIIIHSLLCLAFLFCPLSYLSHFFPSPFLIILFSFLNSPSIYLLGVMNSSMVS